MARLASWNVNGLRACTKNGFLKWVADSGADVIALQEVRAEEMQIPAEILQLTGFHTTWFSAQKKGYSGVGIISRHPFISVKKGMDLEIFDKEGRVITTEFEELYVVSAYFPNSQDKGARLPYKLEFCKTLHQFVSTLRKKGKPVVLTGDFNIAHEAIDLARPDANEETAGFLPEERAWMREFLSSGWIDTFRHQNAAKVQYSWWSARTGARAKNVGWRIDYHAVAKEDAKLILHAGIQDEIYGSDHCPVILDFNVRLS